MTAPEPLPPVPPPKKPPSTARGVVSVLAGWGIALALGALFWVPLEITYAVLGGSESSGARKAPEALLGNRSEAYPKLALASVALQVVVALFLTLTLRHSRKAVAISLGVFALPTLFVAWALWTLTHASFC